MTISWIWAGMVTAALLCGLFFGTLDAVAAAALSGVLNTASIQLLPTTVASVRAAYGSAAPFDILPAVWVSSIASVTVGLLTARLLSRRRGGRL